MEVDWIITGFKTGIIALSGIVANHYRKPFYTWAKAQIKLNDEHLKLKEKVTKLEAQLFIIEGRQQVDLHINNQPTFQANTKGELIYANPAWVTLFEYKDSENAETIKDIYIQTVAYPPGFNDTVKLITKKNRKIISTLCVAELIHDIEGALVGIMGRLHIIDST